MTQLFSQTEQAIVDSGAEEMKKYLRAQEGKGITFAFRKSADDAEGRLVISNQVVSIKQITPFELAKQMLNDLRAPISIERYDALAKGIELKAAQDLGLIPPEL